MRHRGLIKNYVYTLGWIILSAIPLFAYSNCSAEHGGGSGSSDAGLDTAAILRSLRSETEFIFENKCESCHNPTVTNTDLHEFGADYLDGNNFINVGSPQTSPLYLLLIDRIEPPTGSDALSEYELDLIRDWIAAEGGNFDTYIGGTPIDGGGGGGATFSQVRTILNQNCTSCHRAGGTLPRLDVDANTLRNATYQGARLVIPNNASGSLLLQSFSSMPQGDPLGLNSSEANTVRSWINSGAN